MTRSKLVFFLRIAKKNIADSLRISLALGLAIVLASSAFPLAEAPSSGWTKDSGVRLIGGSPFVLALQDGTYRMYYTTIGGGGILSAISSDGLNWTEESGVRIAEGAPGGGEEIVADPTVIQLDDGSYRMYYSGKTGPGGPGTSINRIYSATSFDGLNWQKEGLRVESVGTPDNGWASVPDIVRTFDGRYRLYYVGNANRYSDYMVSAISDDGLNFTREGIVAGIPAMAHDPAVITFSNGTYWLFYSWTYIYTAQSTDGRNFTPDYDAIVVPGGTYDPLMAIDPSVVLFADGTYRVYYWDSSLNPPLIVSASWKPSNPSLRGFSLTLSSNESSFIIPSQGTLVRTYPLEISWPPNFLGNISISASWLGTTPSGINYSLSSDLIAAHWKNFLAESVNLTVNIDTPAMPENYSLKILGRSGEVTESTTQSINLMYARPPDIGEPVQDPPEGVEPHQNVTVTVNVTDLGTGVYNVTLWYSTDNGTTWIPLNMTEISTNTYQTIIPGCENCTWITYRIIAYDNAGNQTAKDNNGYGYTYQVVPEYTSALILPSLTSATLTATILSKKKRKSKICTHAPSLFSTSFVTIHITSDITTENRGPNSTTYRASTVQWQTRCASSEKGYKQNIKIIV